MNKTGTNLSREVWLDVAKFFAIMAVMIDHTNGILYHNQRVAFFSYYSVVLFIIVMGIGIYWEYMDKENCVFYGYDYWFDTN